MDIFHITQSLFITKWIFIVPIFFKLPFIKSSLAFGLQLMIFLCKVTYHEATKNPEVKLLEGQIRPEEFVVLAVIANHTILIFLGSGAITLNMNYTQLNDVICDTNLDNTQHNDTQHRIHSAVSSPIMLSVYCYGN